MAIQLSINEQGRQAQARGEMAMRRAASVRVLAWMAALASLLRRVAMRAFEGIRMAQGSGIKRKQMRLVESLALGNRRQLLLVVCDSQRYLVGAGADSVGSILAMEAETVSRDRTAKGPELVRRRGREAAHEARSRAASEPGFRTGLGPGTGSDFEPGLGAGLGSGSDLWH